MRMPTMTDVHGRMLIEDPPVARYLFQSTGLVGYVWLMVRLFLGYSWIEAGWEKFRDPATTPGTTANAFWSRPLDE